MSSDFNRSPVRARFDLNRRVILPLRREGAEKDIWLYRAINNPIRSDKWPALGFVSPEGAGFV